MNTKLYLLIFKTLQVFVTLVCPLAFGNPIHGPPLSASKRSASATRFRDTPDYIQANFKEQARALFAKCANRSIDIFGEISTGTNIIPIGHPNSPFKIRGEVSLENLTFVHTFEENSDASLWASAQVLIGQFPELVNHTEGFHKSLQKRAGKIGVGLWKGGMFNWDSSPPPCQGKGWQTSAVLLLIS
ncbi:hypothetical protein ABW19_dt0206810 [Dactylella cylindrospora]|nr:hypothetical protein ABW19_dt0206810 [Dactylella cylindrospora]